MRGGDGVERHCTWCTLGRNSYSGWPNSWVIFWATLHLPLNSPPWSSSIGVALLWHWAKPHGTKTQNLLSKLLQINKWIEECYRHLRDPEGREARFVGQERRERSVCLSRSLKICKQSTIFLMKTSAERLKWVTLFLWPKKWRLFHVEPLGQKEPFCSCSIAAVCWHLLHWRTQTCIQMGGSSCCRPEQVPATLGLQGGASVHLPVAQVRSVLCK